MDKKIFVFLILLLLVSFSTQAFASLTFTSNAITGTTPSTIDLGTGNTLSLQTTTNAPITIGTGLVTLGGSLNVAGNIGIGKTNPSVALDVVGAITATGDILGSNIYNDVGDNIALGGGAFYGGHNSNGNVAIGGSAMSSGTASYENVAIGYYSAVSNGIGSFNVAIGSRPLYANIDGSDNIALGASALYNNIASNNIAIGHRALYNNSSATNNIAIGYESGYRSGASLVTTNKVTTGSSLTFLGYNSGLGSATQRTNSTAIGNGAYVDADNTVVLGNASVTNVLMGSTSGATVNAGKYKLSALNTAPSSASDTGTVGEVRFTTTGIYICVATNTWIKAAAAAW